VDFLSEGQVGWGSTEYVVVSMDPRVTELHCIMPMANVASVLVPHRVEARFVTRGAYVVDAAAQARLAALGCTVPIVVDSIFFFR